MDGIHDMGGFHGFGPVDPKNEVTFANDAERRIYAMNMLSIMQGVYNIDKTRYYMENVHPARYLGTSYWERWVGMVETLYAEHGISRHSDKSSIEGTRQLPADRLWDIFRTLRVGPPPPLPDPAYGVGDVVRMRGDSVPTHTRLPRFLRGRAGTIEGYMGIFRFADAFASDRAEHQHVYSVRFTGEEIWGEGCEENTSVQIEIYEPYIAERVTHAA
jgi:nitrile hydratase subunit beta